ncbi:MAG: serine/threonine-protein kinase [Nocardiopsaceae bacterium]|nr:serine/threonine-protein kinase [Nocardiopsaceae bacterium]
MLGTRPLTDEDPRHIGGYALTGRLGQGGQGVVYLGVAHDGAPVAVKTLHAEGLDAAGLRRQLAEEVDTARKVARFCTAQVLAADIDAHPPYVVSEYIEGPTLREAVRQDGPLRGAALERLAVGTLTAIAAIHQAGIVHRDFKPGNVLMGPDGPRVIDFGIARALAGTAILTNRIAGTPAYMAPEQVAGRALGPAIDLFAWGATIVYAANGAGAFGQGSLQEILRRVTHEPADLGVLEGALRDIAERCLAKAPADRPSAAEALMLLLGVDTAADAKAAEQSAGVGSEAEQAEQASAPVPLQTLAAGAVAAAAPEAQERAAAEVYRSFPAVRLPPPGSVAPVARPQTGPGAPMPGPQTGPGRPPGPSGVPRPQSAPFAGPFPSTQPPGAWTGPSTPGSIAADLRGPAPAPPTGPRETPPSGRGGVSSPQPAAPPGAPGRMPPGAPPPWTAGPGGGGGPAPREERPVGRTNVGLLIGAIAAAAVVALLGAVLIALVLSKVSA